MKYLLILLSIQAFANCPFCDGGSAREMQTFYEDDYVIGIYPHKPLLEGHTLAIPKRHVERFEELQPKEVEHLFLLIKKIHTAVSKMCDTKEYFLLQKNGKSAGQSVPHIHIHYIPTKPSTSKIYLFFRFLLEPFISPIPPDEIEKAIANLQHFFPPNA